MDLAYDDVRYTAYRWGFPYLDYSFDVLILWSRKLGLYRWFFHICFHQVLLQICSFVIIIIIIILYMFTSCHTTCVLFHQSPALIIVHHACSLLDITYYLFTCSCISVLMTRFSMHIYKSDLSIHVCLFLHATWHSPYHSLGSFWLPWILMFRSRSLELADSPGC